MLRFKDDGTLSQDSSIARHVQRVSPWYCPSRTWVISCVPRLLSSVDPLEENPWTESILVARSPFGGLGSWHLGVGPQSRQVVPARRRAISASWPIPPELSPDPPPPTPGGCSPHQVRPGDALPEIGPLMPKLMSWPLRLDLHPPSASALLGAGGSLCCPGR
ncbi:hypothetical protein BHE74_00029786 [Ensete ventricosum]|nr:hypothetical protein GW17_00026487 [Ensete ventricosum]RWW63080.1 hypothetical protein BHE74_00029786 [Ensete ventricosum]